MENTSEISEKRNTLMSDLKTVIEDAEALLRSSKQQASQQFDERYKLARERFETTLGKAKVGLSDMEQKVSVRTREAVDSADQYVRENPWQSVGISAAIGAVVGYLLMRR